VLDQMIYHGSQCDAVLLLQELVIGVSLGER
jgi:hypothetical protein